MVADSTIHPNAMGMKIDKDQPLQGVSRVQCHQHVGCLDLALAPRRIIHSLPLMWNSLQHQAKARKCSII